MFKHVEVSKPAGFSKRHAEYRNDFSFLPCPSFEYNGLALNLAKMSFVSVIISLEI